MSSYERERLRVVTNTSGTIEIPANVVVQLDNHHATHVFIGTEFFDAGYNKVVPTDGTITYMVETNELPEYYQSFPDNVLDAGIPASVSVAGNIISVRASFSGITGAVHCRVNVGANVS